MPFLNEYRNITDEFTINTTIANGGYIYSAGKIGNKIFILKLDTNGGFIWQMQYPVTGLVNPLVGQLVGCDNGDVLLSIVDSGNTSIGVVRVNALWGNVVWYKLYTKVFNPQDASLHRIFSLSNIGNDNFVLLFSNKYDSTLAYSQHWLYILKLSGANGNILQHTRIGSNSYSDYFYANQLTHNAVVSGGLIYIIAYHGILQLDMNLNLLNKLRFERQVNQSMPYSFHKFKVIGNKLFFSGIYHLNNRWNTYFALLNPSGLFVNQAISINVLQRPEGAGVAHYIAEANSTSLYVSELNSYRTTKYDINTKAFVLSQKWQSPIYGLENLQSLGANMVFHSRNVLSVTRVIGMLDPDLNSCKSSNVNDFDPISTLTINIKTDYALGQDNLFTIPVANPTMNPEPSNFTLEDVCAYKEQVPLKNTTMLQSPHLYLQSAGSEGTDSTKGIHLRWMLKNGLAKHLPKANYVTGNANFNKQDDFVKVHRAPYTPRVIKVDFSNSPGSVDDNNKRWTYTVGSKLFVVSFKTSSVYVQVRSTINPTQNPLNFVASYFSSGGILEVENQNDLSFAITTNFNPSAVATVKVEYLAVEENKVSAPKLVTLRKNLAFSAINGIKFFNENTRSIRLQSTSTYPVSVLFELYSDFLEKANNSYTWETLGEYALTLDDTLAYNRLEPAANTVNGKWLRYNDNAFVNIDNYKNKWNGASLPVDERIKEGVSTYITLSNAANNPLAIQQYSYDPVPGQVEGQMDSSTFEISNLFLLQTASLDYHIARMMGLGILDRNTKVNTGQYIYIAQYTTFGNLNDGLGSREVHHLYMSLPTSLADHRLPVPVDLQAPKPGIYTSSQVESPASITGPDGYSHDGKARFLSLFHADLPSEDANIPFFYKSDQFISSLNTIPVYAGIEYKRTSDLNWRKPELPYHPSYKNIDATVAQPFEKSETSSIVIPEPGNPLFVHREKESGWHRYSSYGINWFSRAASSNVYHDIETIIAPANQMLPPTNINAVLIQQERPLMFTSGAEQLMLNGITDQDKTLIRLTFDYNHAQELVTYHKMIGNETVSGYAELPDNEEQFADEFEVFFRNRVPGIITGGVTGIIPHPDFLRITLQTGPYTLSSTTVEPSPEVEGGTDSLIPVIPAGSEPNYIGSILLIDTDEYIIDSIDNLSAYPKITVWKRTTTGEVLDENTTGIPGGLVVPQVNSRFLIVENMQLTPTWNTINNINPHNLKINIGHNVIHREDIVTTNMDGVTETHVHKFRGVYKDAIIKKVFEDVQTGVDANGQPILENKHAGLYEIDVPQYFMSQHAQYQGAGDSVEFDKGIVRIHTISEPQGRRKELQVVRSLNIGTPNVALKLFVNDPAFPLDPQSFSEYDGKLMADTAITINQKINYYPGYKVYLHQNATHGLTEEQILPGEDQDIRYSIFGIRSHEISYGFWSPLSMPALMFARKLEEPEQPYPPIGALFATRPDFFGKASYTFTTKFKPSPYSIQFSRASDIQILTAIYNPHPAQAGQLSTVRHIMENILKKGDDEFYEERWNDLLGFDYEMGQFTQYPLGEVMVALPMPDNPAFYAGISAFVADHNTVYGSSITPPQQANIQSLDHEIIPLVTGVHGQLLLKDFIEDAIYNCFVPLTEIPVIYKHVRGTNYVPVPKKQVVRDRHGNLLKPTDPAFDMAPMMKILSPSEYITQFTDYGLDGASNAKYFYAAREFNLQMMAGPHSKILGPISLVNTAAPAAPDIVRVISVLEDRIMEIAPAVQFEINAYQEVQNIRQINIYRAYNKADSLSIRTMDLVKVIDIAEEDMMNQDRWVFRDEFDDLAFVPYGDPLYYKLTVSRLIRYNNIEQETVIEYAPSEATDTVLTNVVNNTIPDSPAVRYYSEPLNNDVLNSVILAWDQTVYNGKYIVYKMNANGNWVQIEEVISNLPVVYLPIGNLTVIDTDGNPIYYHYKVIAQNFSGMRSTQEHILTIYNEETWEDIGGIGDMVIEGTFIVR